MEKIAGSQSIYLTRTPNEAYRIPSNRTVTIVHLECMISALAIASLCSYTLSSYKAGIIGFGIGSLITGMSAKNRYQYFSKFAMESDKKQQKCLENQAKLSFVQMADAFSLPEHTSGEYKQMACVYEKAYSELAQIDADLKSGEISVTSALAKSGLFLCSVIGGAATLRRFSLLPNFVLHTAALGTGACASSRLPIIFSHRALTKEILERNKQQNV